MPNHLNKNSILPKMNNSITPYQNYNSAGATMYTPALQPTAQMPTGTPTGPSYSSPTPVQQTTSTPIVQMPVEAECLVPETVLSTAYTQGYLKTQIGRQVKISFLIGTNMLVDREGTLVDVGTSYIIIREVRTDDLVLCDMYSIKFVRFYY